MSGPVTPLVQPPIEDLRTALQIAESFAAQAEDEDDAVAYGSIARLIRAALEKLGEPNPVTVKVARLILHATGIPLDERTVRDVAALITRTALTWETPR